MGIIILKIIGVLLITALGICLLRKLANNFNAWYYEKQYRAYLQAREACRKEQEKQVEQNNQNLV